MIKRLIFDIDGTLVTGINFDKAITESLLKYNIFSEENKQKFFDAMITYEDNYNEYEKNQYTQYFSKVLGYQFYNDFLDDHFKNLLTYAIPKVNYKLVEKIDQLSKKYELVLLSNYFENLQRDRLEHIGINKYFSEYYGEKICKPNKKVFLEAIRNK